MMLFSFLNFVVAQNISNQAEEKAKFLSSSITGFFKGLFNPLFGDSQVATRVMLAILLGLLIYNVMSTMIPSGHNKTLVWAISIIITIISLIAIPAKFLDAIITQYGAMGAAILSIIPLIIVFWFTVKVNNLYIAKVMWLFYIFYYFGLYIYKLLSLEKWLSPDVIPYGVNLIVGIFMFFIIGYVRDWVFEEVIKSKQEAGEKSNDTLKAVIGLDEERLKSYGANLNK